VKQDDRRWMISSVSYIIPFSCLCQKYLEKAAGFFDFFLKN